ncbi:hypothetical protein NC651_029067 [Populus alba x Populus x berolinensis]|nr:hypothetical protein NC651_029067 [Populus alba x Populus x berolinensis]
MKMRMRRCFDENFPNMLQSRIFDWLETSLLMFQGDLRLYVSIRLMMRPMEPFLRRTCSS